MPAPAGLGGEQPDGATAGTAEAGTDTVRRPRKPYRRPRQG
ncbi:MULTISPECIES: hypothetical protein [unclassified Streptomyces]